MENTYITTISMQGAGELHKVLYHPEGFELQENIETSFPIIPVIKEHMDECKKGHEMEFIAKQFVDKIIDDNPYMPLYVEFLIAKKRNPELEKMMQELQDLTSDRFSTDMGDELGWSFDENIFNVSTDVMNALILASNILGARDNFKKNRHFLERMFLSIFKEGKEN